MRTNRKAEGLQELTDSIMEIKERDVNFFLARFTSLYMDGSYTGYEDYKLNIRKYNRCKNDETRLKFCYSMLTHMCKIEYGSFINETLLREMLKGNLTQDDLEWFEKELLERAYNTLSDDVMA